MTERSDQPKPNPADKERPEVFSVSQGKDGSFHLSRRDLLYVGTVIGGALLLRKACPRFGTTITPGVSLQAGVCVHTAPSIASDIVDTVKGNDLVRLVSDHPDLGWVEVATQSSQQGWVKRDYLDFSRAVKSRSTSFSLSGEKTPTPADIRQPHLTVTIQSSSCDEKPSTVRPEGRTQDCGDAIQNGDFEGGSAYWSEVTTGAIITNEWPDPYSGDWVAWFGGPDANERLTQEFHVPDNIQDAQRLEFYLKVTTYETGDQVVDTFFLRLLDAGGNPIWEDTAIADNTTQPNWLFFWVDITGMSLVAGQDMQIQFACVTDSPNDTYFVLDKVSMNLVCEDDPVYYIYLPVIMLQPTPTPSPTPCTSDCGSDCGGYCGSDSCSTDYCSTDYCSTICDADYCSLDICGLDNPCPSYGCYDWSW